MCYTLHWAVIHHIRLFLSAEKAHLIVELITSKVLTFTNQVGLSIFTIAYFQSIGLTTPYIMSIN